ncbi:hypothetical protein N596_05705 [Streptococcus ilei]|nr:hypothetical protein N596_05705 [Streptococcus ilei]
MAKKIKKRKDRPEITRHYSKRSRFSLKKRLKIVSLFQPE